MDFLSLIEHASPGLPDSASGVMKNAMDDEQTLAKVNELIDRYRDRCLWFLPQDYRVRTTSEALRALDHIERHGDVRAFREARTLKRWLSPSSNATSAD